MRRKSNSFCRIMRRKASIVLRLLVRTLFNRSFCNCKNAAFNLFHSGELSSAVDNKIESAAPQGADSVVSSIPDMKKLKK